MLAYVDHTTHEAADTFYPGYAKARYASEIVQAADGAAFLYGLLSKEVPA
jgi:hypothetical protein